MVLKPVLLLDEYMTLGEGPFWDESEQALYWVDTDSMQVHSFDPIEGHRRTYQLSQKVGVAVKESSETLICALEDGIYRLNQKDTSLELIVSPEADKPMNVFNDGKCDKNGNFWIGSVHRQELDHEGTLFCIKPDNSVSPVIEGVSISNGMAWADDNQTMYYIDTPTRKVISFEFDQEVCEVANKRTVIDFPTELGMPDGITIDIEGNLWVAMWGGSCVCKCDPRRGQIVEKISLPVSNVTSCVFGGRDMDTLFITTAQAELTDTEKREQPLAGGLFMVKTNTKGYPSNRFGSNNNKAKGEA